MAGSRAAVTRQKTRQAREKGVGITLTVDGVQHTVFQDDLSAMDSRALRREVGLSFVGVLRAMNTDPDIDLFAAIVWLSRRVHGERDLEFAEVATEFTYRTEYEVGDPPDSDEGSADGDGLPEA